MLKKIIPAYFILIFMLFYTMNICTAANPASQKPVKIVILPIINPSAEYPDVNVYIDKQLHRAVHIPLNGVLEKTALIDTNAINTALQALNINADDLDNKNSLQSLAQSLNSDLIISIKILRMHQYINYAPVNIVEPVIHSSVCLQLSVYDSRTNLYKSYNKAAFFDDSYSPQGTVQSLTSDVLYNLLRKAQLKQYI